MTAIALVTHKKFVRLVIYIFLGTRPMHQKKEKQKLCRWNFHGMKGLLGEVHCYLFFFTFLQW